MQNMLQKIVSNMKLTSLKKYLQLMHVCGLLSLPDYSKDPKNIQKQKLYTICNRTFVTILIISFGINLFMNTIKNASLFCENLFVLSIVIATFGTACLIQIRLKMFIQTLDFFETTARLHRENKAVSRLQNIERMFIPVALLTTAVLVFLHVIVYPGLPKSTEELETLSKVYNLKYPQNALGFPLFIPFVDTSDPKVFYLSFGLEIYGAIMVTLADVLTIVVYPLSVLHLKYHFTILKDLTLLVGKTHFNSCGQPIFYKNLLENEKVIRRFKKDGKKLEPPMSEQDKHLSHWFERHPDLYETFYLREIILFQKALIRQRKRLDEYFSNMFLLLAPMAMLMLTTSMYGSLTPIWATTLAQSKMIFQASLVLTFVFLYFYCGELLAGCNESLVSGLWQSWWYTCSTRTQRDMIVFLRMNQKLNYYTMIYVCQWGYKAMLSGVKFGYSVINVLRIRKNSQF
uniref:Odorant receptor n=2 Tax=Cacopsylla melanoneura TaxID=428564 RepID=A0A8D8V9B8_9HEMI